MARGVTRLPKSRQAIRPIEREPRNTASLEAAKILALHEQTTKNQSVAPESTNTHPAANSPVLTGSGVGRAIRIRGGGFAPASNASNFR